ncbi:MAG: radical SAM protein [Deltaproteobacteria bacterium]|nr:radical SAM protein [Deltaproteobacteria bacterium]
MLSVSKLLGSGLSGRETTEAMRYSREDRPVVVWNISRSCALHCVHCYNSSEEKTYPGELTTSEAKRAIDGLAAFNVPALIFSGGDPLLRHDLFELIRYAREKGVRPVLSTSGVTIDRDAARKIKDSGVLYVGVSLDGGEEVNDRLRGVKGAYQKALDGMRYCRDSGLVVGVRFTMSKKTVGELPVIFDLLETENIQRGYFAHLVYSGRGEKFSREDLDHAETKAAVDYVFDQARDFIRRGLKKDIVTGSNDVDGVYLYLKLKEKEDDRADAIYNLLLGRGGNSSGVMLGNIDNLGNVHADQFWSQHSFGNVNERPFGEIWTDTADPLMRALKNRKGVVKGRCSACPYFDICGGNYRVRAEFVTGDLWAEDPACYLTDSELGIKR